MKKTPLISCANLRIQLGNETVFQNLSFNIPQGEHTVLKGESGSGKSTLLNLLLGFLSPSSGTIQFNSGSNTPSIRQKTAWLPQDLDLGTGMVEKLILKPFEFTSNRSSRPARTTYLSVFKELGLVEADLSKSFQTLSTGQRQRVGIAICHLLDKPLLLLDEPTSALDKTSKQRVANLLLTHTRKTIVSTSHDPFWINHAENIISLD